MDSGGRRLGGSLRWQLTGWTLAGVGFFLLLAPKALTHDYYALMLVPAASLWGAAGWRQLSTRHSSVTSHDSPLTARSWALPVVLIAAALAGSPWIGARRLFAEEEGLNRFAAMLAVHTEPDACICVVETQGGGATLTSLAEAGRIGWVRDAAPSGPEAWLEPGRIAAAGADYVAFYVNRAHYEGPALPDWAEQLTIVARQHGPWAKDGRTCTIVLARLDPLPTPPDEWRPDGRSRLPSGTFAPRP